MPDIRASFFFLWKLSQRCLVRDVYCVGQGASVFFRDYYYLHFVKGRSRGLELAVYTIQAVLFLFCNFVNDKFKRIPSSAMMYVAAICSCQTVMS